MRFCSPFGLLFSLRGCFFLCYYDAVAEVPLIDMCDVATLFSPCHLSDYVDDSRLRARVRLPVITSSTEPILYFPPSFSTTPTSPCSNLDGDFFLQARRSLESAWDVKEEGGPPPLPPFLPPPGRLLSFLFSDFWAISRPFLFPAAMAFWPRQLSIVALCRKAAIFRCPFFLCGASLSFLSSRFGRIFLFVSLKGCVQARRLDTTLWLRGANFSLPGSIHAFTALWRVKLGILHFLPPLSSCERARTFIFFGEALSSGLVPLAFLFRLFPLRPFRCLTRHYFLFALQ